MKGRSISIAIFGLACVSIGLWTSSSAHSQGGAIKNYMWLQGATPGTTQSGHGNISGTMRAGSFSGSGSGITNVPSASLTGLINLGIIPVPFALSGGAPATSIISATSSSTNAAASAIRAESTAAIGFTYTMYANNSSSSGRSVFGWADSPTGTNYGGYFRTDSDTGIGLYGWANANSGANFGIMGETDSPQGTAIYALHNATTGAATGILSESSSPNGHAILGRNLSPTGTAYGVAGETSSTLGRAVVGRATSGTGTTYGVYGFNTSTSGYGVYGTASANSGETYGVRGNADSNTGYGVYGSSPNVGVGGYSTKYGIYGEGTSTTGYGIYGTNFSTGDTVAIYGLAQSNTGIGVKGQGGGSAGTPGVFGLNPNFGYGVKGQALGSGGVGVFGQASVGLESIATASGMLAYGPVRGVLGQVTGNDLDRVGVEGRVYTNGSSGVLGSNLNVAGQTGGVGYGVYGLSDRATDRAMLGDSDATSGTPYGVFGDTDGFGIALYASGNFSASGTKAFRIDHPLDPANKYLYHYCSESPEPMNTYSGNVTTGANGYAWIELPDYFESINRDLRYQLTVIDDSDDFVMAKVTQECKNGRFQVRTNKPNIKVSWRVEGVRNDAYVRHYPPVREEYKPTNERGLYDHPEIFGLGRELSQQHDQPAYESRIKPSDEQLRGKGKFGSTVQQSNRGKK